MQLIIPDQPEVDAGATPHFELKYERIDAYKALTSWVQDAADAELMAEWFTHWASLVVERNKIAPAQVTRFCTECCWKGRADAATGTWTCPKCKATRRRNVSKLDYRAA